MVTVILMLSLAVKEIVTAVVSNRSQGDVLQKWCVMCFLTQRAMQVRWITTLKDLNTVPSNWCQYLVQPNYCS